MPLAARTPVGTVRVPTLHVWGDGDTFLGRAATEASAEFVAAPYRLEVLDGANHWIPELAADRAGELITAHVRTAG
jgi:pimeloyl-ACP methyl ester carboxylesterase